MNYKDIIIIVILIAILVIVLKMMKTNNTHLQLSTAIASKTGVLPSLNEYSSQKGFIKKSKAQDNDQEEENNSSGQIKKIKLKKIHKQIISLFNDGIPKTTTEIKKAYKSAFKEIDNVKMDNTIWNMKAGGIINVEKVDDKKNYWGPVEWFDEEGLFLEEYIDTLDNQKENKDNDDVPTTKLTIIKK